MAENNDNRTVQEVWLPVIGNALALLCLEKFSEKNADKTDSVLKKVAFLQGLGVPPKDAAHAAGSNADSVRAMKSQAKGGKRGAAKRK